MCARIASPCVGLCSTTLGDPICRGCQRTDSEIGEWMALTAEQRSLRMAQLDTLRERVAGRFLQVIDEAMLEAQLRRYRIRFRPEQPSLSRAVELLRVGRDRIRDLSRYGLKPLEGVAELSAAELYVRLGEHLLEAAGERQASSKYPPLPHDSHDQEYRA
ncbi:DUF1289 domain-containing protein [Halomonas sp. MCCC 1A11062]|uniref:DUF1289 domain-containing protein n=1 Tax=Halomonas sp. MCCC 1A11062 TaxID=2733485 RepID=UPI001F484E2B|nr:DUF1289 domain-containing protein [Halomonas sp. MCCC 1A11062]MCE8038330.1 DUF1289 domain-containing protein [Halomonas sp. MCCC 1A11062]